MGNDEKMQILVIGGSLGSVLRFGRHDYPSRQSWRRSDSNDPDIWDRITL